MLYRVVTQTVILVSSETWILLAAMERTVEGTHNGFLSSITGKRSRQKSDGEWVTPRE